MKRHSYLYKKKKSHSRFARRPNFRPYVHVDSVEDKTDTIVNEVELEESTLKKPLKTRIHGFMERQRKYHSQELLHRKKKIEKVFRNHKK